MTIARAVLVFSTVLACSLGVYSALKSTICLELSLWASGIYLGLLCIGRFFPRLQMFTDLICFVPTSEKRVGLTIDFSLDERSTWRVLGVLKEYQAAATFFIPARELQSCSELTEKIIGQGHEIALLAEMPFVELRSKMRRKVEPMISEDLQNLEKVGVERPRWYRTPGLYARPRVAQAVRRAHLEVVGASTEFFPDFLKMKAPKAARKLERALLPGAIIKLGLRAKKGHEVDEAGALEVIKLILQASTARRLQPVTLAELMTSSLKS